MAEASALFCLVAFSIVGAWVFRLFWIRLKAGFLKPISYVDYFDSFTTAVQSILLPALVAGAAVWWCRYRLLRSARVKSRFLSGLIALTAFYGIMMGYTSLTQIEAVFPVPTWCLSLLLSFIAYSATEASGRLNPGARLDTAVGRPVHLLIDATVSGVALLLAYLVRFDAQVPSRFTDQFLTLVLLVAALQLTANYFLRVYSFIWKFTGLKEAIVIAQAVATASLVAITIRMSFSEIDLLRVPLGVLMVQPILAYIGLLSVRVVRRLQFVAQKKRGHHSSEATKHFLLVGAGQAGRALAREMEHLDGVQLVGFLDDDPQKSKRVVDGLRVLGTTADVREIVRQFAVSEVALCMPSASRMQLRQIVAACEEIKVNVSSVPSLSEIVLGKFAISRLRPVKMEDLLGRACIEYAEADPFLKGNYRNRRIMVTGAAGSIGSELVRQLKEFEPSHLILVDKDENGLHEICLETCGTSAPVAQVVANIRSFPKMWRVFDQYRPQIVFHAAAYKHVPLMEHNPDEAILNNVVGSRNLVNLSAEFGVRHFVLVSTDKAVNPTNIMGASKRLAEMVVQQKAAQAQTTKFCCVRFGNVLGSRASVVPLFQKQIEEGKNITVTHPEVERYFMTIPEAVQLVIQAGSLGSKGEIFVLDMGNPVKILDLAKGLIELSGLTEGRDISIEFTGLRPGEKLFEELLTASENGARNTLYPKIFVVSASEGDWDHLDQTIGELEEAASCGDGHHIVELLRSARIGYASPVVGSAEDTAAVREVSTAT